MALIGINLDGSYATECAICKRTLAAPIFATAHFITDPSDRLFEYSDAAMHWDCYASWKYQRRFASQYFEAKRQWMSRNPHWSVVVDCVNFVVFANPDRDVAEADLALRSIGPGFRVPIQEWKNWINAGWESSCDHELQWTAMADVEATVRSVLPDSDTLLALARRNLHRDVE